MTRRAATAALLATVTAGLVATPWPSGSAAAQGLDLTCTLPLTRSDPAVANTAFPDEAAVYYGGGYLAAPGLRLRIDGRFPHARYMSFNLYDAAARPIDALADVELAPAAGSANPFVAGVDRTSEKRSYTAFVDFGARPATRSPNTLYGGSGQGGAANLGGLFLYRIYLPDEGRDATGGVGLPTVTLQAADGGPAAPSSCSDLVRPSPPGVNEAIASSNGLPVPEQGELSGRNPPVWTKFTSLPRSFTDALFANPYGDPFRSLTDALPVDQLGGTGGFLSNTHNAYLTTATNRSRGRVVATRMRAPTFAATRPAARTMPASQLRYFSFCQNEFATQRFIACATDDRTAIGRDGFMTYVVSTPADRPANATAACGVTWVPWGPDQTGVLIYRHMLPDPSFAQAIQRTARTEEAKVMGDYLPVSRYYATRADFESLGCAAAAPAAVPGGPGCRAVAPIVAFARNGVRVRRRALRVRGSARAFACAGRPRVTRVEVALRTRPRAGRCRTVGTRGRLSAPRRCARVHWLRARIRGRGWSLSRGLSLPAGRYLVLVRSRDGRGRRSRIVSRAARVR